MGNLRDLIQKQEYRQFKLLSGREIGAKAWKVKEEKDFLFSIEGAKGNEDIIKDEAIKLVRRCVDPEEVEVFDNLSEADLLDLLIQIRKESKGNTVNFTFDCKNKIERDVTKPDPETGELKTEHISKPCHGFSIPAQIDLDGEEIEVKEYNSEPIDIDGYTFTLKEVPYAEKKKLSRDHGKNFAKYNYNYLLKSINAITAGGETYTEFTKDELRDFIDGLSSQQLEKLYEEMRDRFSSIIINKKVRCPICSNESDVLFNDMFSVMVF